MENIKLFLKEIFSDKNLITALIPRIRHLNIPDKQFILKEGEYIQVVPLVMNGRFRVVQADESGKEILLYYIEPGESCAISISTGLNHEKSRIIAESTEPTEFLAIPIRVLEEFFPKYPDLNRFILKTYHTRYIELVNYIDNIVFKTVDQRLINLLHSKKGKNGYPIIKMTHQQIAFELGTAREVISRTLKALEKENKIINHRGYIEVINL